MDGFLHPLPDLTPDPIVEPQIGYNWTIPIGMIAFAALVIACFAIGGYITYRVPEPEQSGFTTLQDDHLNVNKTVSVGGKLDAKSQSLGFLGTVSQDMIAQLLMSGQTISANGLILIPDLLYPAGGPTYINAYAAAKNLSLKFSRMTTNPKVPKDVNDVTNDKLADDLVGGTVGGVGGAFVDPLQLSSPEEETITLANSKVQLITSTNLSTAKPLTFKIQRRIPDDANIHNLFVFTSPWLLEDKELKITTDPVTFNYGDNPLRIGGDNSGVVREQSIMVRVHVTAGQGDALQALKTRLDTGKDDEIILNHVAGATDGANDINGVLLATLNGSQDITDVDPINNFIAFEIPNIGGTANGNNIANPVGGTGVTVTFQNNTFNDMTVFTSKPGTDLKGKEGSGGVNHTTLTLTGQKGPNSNNPSTGSTTILPGSFIYVDSIDKGDTSDIQGTVMILTDGDEFASVEFS